MLRAMGYLSHMTTKLKENWMAFLVRQPPIVVRMDESYLTRTEAGEILETVDLDSSGMPDWDHATVADLRGAGGVEGFQALHSAFDALEANHSMVNGGRDW